MGRCQLSTVRISFATSSKLTRYPSVSRQGTKAAEWDRATYTQFWKLAHEDPSAGISIYRTHCPCCRIAITYIAHTAAYLLKLAQESEDTAITDWLSELLSETPWFADVVPDVSDPYTTSPGRIL